VQKELEAINLGGTAKSGGADVAGGDAMTEEAATAAGSVGKVDA